MTFAEVMVELKAGKKLRREIWDAQTWMALAGGDLVWSVYGKPATTECAIGCLGWADISATDWRAVGDPAGASETGIVEDNGDSEKWVDAKAIAEHLGFKPDHIRVLARAKQLPGVQLQNGSREYWRFKISEIDRWMAAN